MGHSGFTKAYLAKCDRYFALEFHLRFFVWRTHCELKRDPRTGKSKRPLRKSRDLSFLRDTPRPDGLQEVLYDAGVSCLITGVNTDIWSGYLVVDSYYEDEDDDRDTVKFRDDNRPPVGDIDVDHFFAFGHGAHGETVVEMDCSPRDPRRYFLDVLISHMLRSKAEWENVFDRLQDRFVRQPPSPPHPPPSMPGRRFTPYLPLTWARAMGKIYTQAQSTTFIRLPRRQNDEI